MKLLRNSRNAKDEDEKVQRIHRPAEKGCQKCMPLRRSGAEVMNDSAKVIDQRNDEDDEDIAGSIAERIQENTTDTTCQQQARILFP